MVGKCGGRKSVLYKKRGVTVRSGFDEGIGCLNVYDLHICA